MRNAADLTGQVFGRLTVKEHVPNKASGKSKWLCICICGGSTITDITKLRSGHTQSCGCLFLEKIRALRATNDLSGKRNGRLLILNRDGVGTGSERYKWNCICDCGKSVRVSAYQLQPGRTESCGCKKRDLTISKNTIHGLSKTKQYRIAKDARRRRCIEASPSHFTADDIEDLLKLQKNKCACCKKSLNGKYDVDHIQSLKKGGDNSRLNIQILCPRCNRKKSAKDPIQFMQEQGYLI